MQARADGSPEDARQEAPGACQDNRTPAITAASHGIDRELRKQQSILEQEIAE
jgi:hypothetical protein